MRVTVDGTRALRFDDGAPVRAASAIARLGDGWLIAQDDATHAAWARGDRVTPLRLLPAVSGHDVFADADATKQLKPDLEAACPVEVGGAQAVLLLGSGATHARRRAVLVVGTEQPAVSAADLGALYDAVGSALGVPAGQLNLEGAAVLGGVLRWFQRGNLTAGVPSGSVDVDLVAVLDAMRGERDPGAVPVTGVRHYDLGAVNGVGLSVTDAVALPDGRVLVSAAAEDTSNPVDDGPVVGSALALLDDDGLLDHVLLPELDGVAAKVEGLALVQTTAGAAELLAVVDADEPRAASTQLSLTARWRREEGSAR